MGLALAEAYPSARAAFDEANDALGYDLAAICFTGPAEALVPTDVCQPAILATSVAAWRVAAEQGLGGDMVMGHCGDARRGPRAPRNDGGAARSE